MDTFFASSLSSPNSGAPLLEPPPPPPLPYRGPLAVLYIDSALVVVAKPAGMLSVPGRILQDSVLSRLQAWGLEAKACHRLDMATTGLLVMARTRAAQRCLAWQFEQRKIAKTYRAWVVGRPQGHPRSKEASAVWLPAWEHIDLPLEPDLTHAPRYRIATHASKRVKKSEPKVSRRRRAKTAQTYWQRVRYDAHRNATLLNLVPKTGRSHQLRVHLAQGLGTPILGDALYGGGSQEMLHLWATRLGLAHPTTGIWCEWDLPWAFLTGGDEKAKVADATVKAQHGAPFGC